MDPTKSQAEAIFEFIKLQGQTTPLEIQKNFTVSQVTIFKHLKRLLGQGLIQKAGTTPKVYYRSVDQKAILDIAVDTLKLDEKAEKLFEDKFVNISAEGMISFGYNGFRLWCEKQNLDLEKTTTEFLKTWVKYKKYVSVYKTFSFIDASFKLIETYGKSAILDKLIYLDFYDIERFGKTKLALLTFQAKQSQDQKLIKTIVNQTKSEIEFLIKKFKIEAVGFVPATVNRKVQFMKVFEDMLDLSLPKIKIEKVIYDTPVQQKTLKNINDRLDNANKTFYIPEQNQYKNVLLIDDFVGSGATLNQVAIKIRSKKIAKNIIGIAITGSFKGFEVINQV